MNSVLVTGASGFIGRALCEQLIARGTFVVGAIRKQHTGMLDTSGIRPVEMGDLDGDTNWMATLAGIDCVVHLAARVHVMRETERDALAVFRQINTQGTTSLALQAAAAGVKRLIYVSTIKVNGEETTDLPFSERDNPQPHDAYAISKWEAEQALMRISKESGMEVVVVRPPLVYGAGVKGNFLSLMQLVHKGIPLPVGSCHNRRSLLGLGNFVDFLATCIGHAAAAGRTFVLSDGEDLSTPELVRRLAKAMNRPARLLPVPPGLLRFATKLVGRPGIYHRLCGSLVVDTRQARELLGWTPPESVDAGIGATVQTFLRQQLS